MALEGVEVDRDEEPKPPEIERDDGLEEDREGDAERLDGVVDLDGAADRDVDGVERDGATERGVEGRLGATRLGVDEDGVERGETARGVDGAAEGAFTERRWLTLGALEAEPLLDDLGVEVAFRLGDAFL